MNVTNEQTSNNDIAKNASSKSKAAGKLYYLNTRVVNSGSG